MPQFLILADDYTDPDALSKRLSVREDHLKRMKKEKEAGRFIIGGATINEASQMYGSMLIVSFPDIESVNQWLKEDPYTTGKVWEKTQVVAFKIADV